MDQIVPQLPANEKFEREVINALGARGVGRVGAAMPAIDHAVPHGQRDRDIPIAIVGRDAVFADLIVELLLDAVPHGSDIPRPGQGWAFLLNGLDLGGSVFLERHESLSPQRSRARSSR